MFESFGYTVVDDALPLDRRTSARNALKIVHRFIAACIEAEEENGRVLGIFYYNGHSVRNNKDIPLWGA